jgi:hypothetical protein
VGRRTQTEESLDRASRALRDATLAFDSGAFDESRYEDNRVIDAGESVLVLTTFVVDGRRPVSLLRPRWTCPQVALRLAVLNSAGASWTTATGLRSRSGTARSYLGATTERAKRRSKPWGCGSSGVSG